MGKPGEAQVGVVAALVRSTFLVNAVYAEAGRDHGLTPQQGQLLCVLMAQPHGMGELGAMLRLAKSSLTGLVDRTERNGLVRREAVSGDSRAVRVALTARGSTVAEEFYADACRRIDDLSTELDGAERGQLADLLGRIVLANQVPEVFMEPEDGPPAARRTAG
jgi:DNA-binding MarR family transcriptional regulator